MVDPRRFLTEDEGDRIAKAVAEAERTTSGEIRVLVVGQSMRWAWALPLLGGLAAAGAALWVTITSAWGYASLRELATAGTVVGAGAMLVLGSIVWFSPLRHAAVRRRAEREFVRLGIAQTRDHTGVLLMLSLRERMVQVLADRAINEKVPPGTWEPLAAGIADAIRQKRTADGLCEAVQKVGEYLAAHFPRRSDDANELPDRPEVAS